MRKKLQKIRLPDAALEKKIRRLGFRLIAGIDEAGRGPLAGPVVAGAVILKTFRFQNRIHDSKLLSARGRMNAYREIIRKAHVGVGIVSEKIIDRVNIQQAALLACRRALHNLSVTPHFLLLDGLLHLEEGLPSIQLIRGDQRSLSIACASIVAKITRDRIMVRLHKKFPQYDFSAHKGYGTARHLKALRKHGPSACHRMSFEPVRQAVWAHIDPRGLYGFWKYKILPVLLIAALLSGCTSGSVFRRHHIRRDQKTVYSKDIHIQKPAGSFSAGEKLTYRVFWLGIEVGEVVSTITGIEEIAGRKAYRIELTAKTNDFASKIYKIDDRYVSYMDIKDLVTLRHEVLRQEGRFRKDAVTIFDQELHSAHFENVVDKSRKDFPIPTRAQDTLTAAYFFRTIPVKEGERINYEVINNERNYSLFGLVGSKSFVKVPSFATFETFTIEPYAKLGSERVRKGNVTCYFSCDPRRLPVFATIRAPLFTSITVTLSKPE